MSRLHRVPLIRAMVVSLALVLLCTACATRGRLYDQLRVGQLSVYVGMSGQQITGVLGPPNNIGRGTYGSHYTGQFLLFTAGRNTLEWAWNLVDQSILVAYLDYNQVRYLGLISPEK